MSVFMPSKPPSHRPPGWKDPALKRLEFDRQRNPEKNVIYDSAWRKVRKQFLAAHPMCCEAGCGKLATDVDHIKSARDYPALRLHWSNLRPFCHPHHSARTSREQSWGRGMGV